MKKIKKKMLNDEKSYCYYFYKNLNSSNKIFGFILFGFIIFLLINSGFFIQTNEEQYKINIQVLFILLLTTFFIYFCMVFLYSYYKYIKQ